MMMKSSLKMLVASVVAIGMSTAAYAGPIAGVTYTYDPATSPFNGFAPDSGGQLTDGVHGSTVPDPLIDPLAAFRNGTWVGFTENGATNPQPGVDLNLGGTFLVDSVEVEFLIEPGPAIFAPQTPTGGNALTILDGATVLGTFDAFPPIDWGQAPEVFTAVVPLGGVSLSSLTVDVRSPFDHIFVAEITVNEVPEPASMALLSAGGLLILRRRR
jgi:PEP-CTERM motif